MNNLPIDPYVPAIVEHARIRRAVVVTAAPGAGKTTRVPPALVEDGPVFVLQPRRVAARAIARRIAEERGWTVGREVGWHVRFDRRVSADTKLTVATEGILTARLESDPLLADVRTVVVDEFHERSIHADLGVALLKQAWRARDDLRLIIMSATLDARQVAAFLDDCPVVEVQGRGFPVEILYRPGQPIEEAAAEASRSGRGAVLCFLPGAPEILRARDGLVSRVPAGLDVLPLHGGLDAEAQDAAVRPSDRPRVILATNLAETTLTVPDVTAVIDTGLKKTMRHDAHRGIDSLETERISIDEADQRAGRAGRTAPGRALRLWDARDRLRPHREPDILRIDLASVVLDVLTWGGDPRSFEWFEAPPPHAIDGALVLLARLGAVNPANRLTALGQAMQRLPLHPRLARLVLAAHGAPIAARASALLSERHFAPRTGSTTSCDVLAAVEDAQALPPHIRQTTDDIAAAARRVFGGRTAPAIGESEFRKALFESYPDRLARRRQPGSERVVLASGAGARLGRESGVRDAEFLVAVDVGGPRAGGEAAADEAVVRMASAVDREWIQPTDSRLEHHIDATTGIVRARRLEMFGELVLREHAAAVDPGIAHALIVEAYIERGPTAADRQLIHRLAAAGAGADFASLVRDAAREASSVDDIDLAGALAGDLRARLARDAPDVLTLPSGRATRLEYRDEGRIVASAKLQELFGLGETPRVGPNRLPVTFELLAPNGRPVQVTADLASFWTTTYPALRGPLRARYPRHPWPEDPWTAVPTQRATPRRR